MKIRCPFRWKRALALFYSINVLIIFIYLIAVTLPKYRKPIQTPNLKKGAVGKYLIDTGWLSNLVTRNETPYPFNYILNVKSDCNNSSELFVPVMTSPAHSAHRKAIRETWGQALKAEKAQVVFFLGSSVNSRYADSIVNESNIYKDIVQEDYIDSYRNLTLKTFSIMNWIVQFCPMVKFIFKADDDIFVNVQVLMKTMRTYNESVAAIYGLLARDWQPFRNPKNKYFVSKTSYPFKYYPDFIAGPAYVVSGSAVATIFNMAKMMDVFPLEDVFFTGFAALAANVPRINQAGFKSSKDKFLPCKFNKSITSHGHTPNQISALWKRVHSKSFLCPKKVH